MKCNYCKKKEGKWIMIDSVKNYYYCSKLCIANEFMKIYDIKLNTGFKQ